MSNSPNMSYCQMRNTLAALRQVRETIEALLASDVENCGDLPLNPSTRTGGKRQEIEIQKEIDDREYKLRLLREAIAYFER